MDVLMKVLEICLIPVGQNIMERNKLFGHQKADPVYLKL